MPEGRSDNVMKKSLRIAGGSTTTLAGVALLVLPGPGIPLLILGLGILAKDIPVAARLHGRVLHHSRRAARGVNNGIGKRFRRG